MIKGYSLDSQDTATVDYVMRVFEPEDATLLKIKCESIKGGLPEIQVGAADGLHLEVFTRMIRAKKAVEIGTLGGYSGTCIARGLSEDGKLHTFELNPDQARVAQSNFETAGVSDKITIHTGVALKILPSIEDQGPFDLVFIDADKTSYPAYYEWAKRNLRKGGVLIADNTFSFGNIGKSHIADPEALAAALALRKFNELCARSGDFRATILPTYEGLTIAVKY